MKKVDCEIIQDLLPLYIDNICSEKSKELINIHICSCDECLRDLNIMRESMFLIEPHTNSDNNSEIDILKKIKSSLLKKNIKLVAISCIFITIVFVLLGLYIFKHEDVILYKDVSIKIDEFGPEKNIIYTGPANNLVKSTEKTIKETDDTIYQSINLWLTKTPYTTFTKPNLKNYSVFTLNDYVDSVDVEHPDTKKVYKPVEIYYTDGISGESHLLWKDKTF